MPKGVEESGRIINPVSEGGRNETSMSIQYPYTSCCFHYPHAAVLEPNLSGSAQAKTYPDKSRSVNVIVAYPPGGGTDVAARVMTPLLEKEMGIPVVVLNKGGAGGQIGFTEIARSRPDGYTIGYLIIPTVITTYLDPDRKAVFSRKSFELLAMQDHDPGVLAREGR